MKYVLNYCPSAKCTEHRTFQLWNSALCAEEDGKCQQSNVLYVNNRKSFRGANVGVQVAIVIHVCRNMFVLLNVLTILTSVRQKRKNCNKISFVNTLTTSLLNNMSLIATNADIHAA